MKIDLRTADDILSSGQSTASTQRTIKGEKLKEDTGRETEGKREAKRWVEREDMIGLCQCRKIVSFGPVL